MHSYVLANWDPIENFDFISPLVFVFVFFLDDFSLWPMTKHSYQPNHEISLASSHFYLFAFSIPINWVKYVNSETLRKETENLEMRKNMRTLPHTTTERKAERWLYSWEDCQRDHHTHRKETITGYLHSAFFMTLVFFQGGVIYVLVMFDNKSFKRVANVMLIYLFTWEMLRSHTGVHIFCNSVNAWERR